MRSWPEQNAPESKLTLDQVVGAVRSAYPGGRVIAVAVPTRQEPYFQTTLQGRTGRVKILTHPRSGDMRLERKRERFWLDAVADLHTTLLAGRKGRMANGIGAALLLLLNGTGLVVWWSGVTRWIRGLTIEWRRKWRRTNYDLHRALGFWTLGAVSCWAISGVYFAWPVAFVHGLNRLSPLVSSQPPAVRLKPIVLASAPRPDLETLVANAKRADPGTALAVVNFPYSRQAPWEVSLQRGERPGREYIDIVYLDPRDGRPLQTWRYGVNQSLGDWVLWLQVPLHYGRSWGLGFQALWCLLGLSIPVLALTGALLYWNRVLRHRVARLKKP